jgi:CP family cyanate transporter-like MFS transporter
MTQPPPATRVLRPALLLAGVFLLAANMRAALTVVSPLMSEIRADLDIGSAGASALISLPLLCFAAVSPLAPKLARRLGTEATLTSALVVLMVGIVLRSLPIPSLLWVGTVLIGSAIACINVLLPSLLKRDFPERVGALTGAYNGVQSAFAALAAGFAVPIAGLPGSGWRLALGCTAAVALIGLAVMLPQLRVNAPQPAAPGTATHDGTRPSLLRSAIAWQVALFMGLQSCVFYSMVTWWPTIEHSFGISTSAAGVHAAVFQATGIVGSLATGALLKRVPRPATVTPVAFSVVGIFGMVLAPSAALAWTIVIGLGAGGCIVAALALFSARTRDHLRAAELSGMGQSVGYLLAAALPPTLGALHDATGGWQIPLLALGATVLLALIFAVLGSRDRVVE